MSMKLNEKELKTLTQTDVKHLYELYARQNGYSECPPSISEFISDDYYLGSSLHQGGDIFPYWKKVLTNLYPTPFYESNKHKVLLLSGATGTGKSTVSSIIFLYDLARLLCMDEPQTKFKLPKAAKIYFTLTNSTLENVEQVNYDPIISFIRESPFFRSKFNNYKSKTSLFINNIDINMVSNKRSLVGKNIYAASSDEINVEVRRGGSKNIVVEMYNRINSRFLLPDNKWAGVYTMISSATTEGSLIQTMMDNAEDKDDEAFNKNDILVVSGSRFDILKHKMNYSGQTFRIFIGDYQSDPYFIENEDDEKRATLLDRTKIYDVPIEHRGEFDDIYAGIRDVLGKSVSDVRTFIPFKERIKNVLMLGNPAPSEIILDEHEKLIDKFDLTRLDIFKPGSQKVIGLDIAYAGDRYGLCMLHIHDAQGEGHLQELTYWADFVVGIKAPKGQQLKLYQVREFIVELIKMGIGVTHAVSDSFQSTDTLQLLEKQGIEAIAHSVDRKKDAYYGLRDAILDDRIKMPYNEILYRELVFLKEDAKKIDHPATFPDDGTSGSKDLADAVANALWVAQNNLEYLPYMDRGFIDELDSLNDEVDDENPFADIFGPGTTGNFVE